ncbi:SNF2/RAD54 helicase family protein [Vairimorpha necatrix]|uniref:SNF2/RAD54 helicase family protein n=1 Tax=Vairimorpha necatrix TaxID=6039 RepID=A0AAX4J9J1_9MICR
MDQKNKATWQKIIEKKLVKNLSSEKTKKNDTEVNNLQSRMKKSEEIIVSDSKKEPEKEQSYKLKVYVNEQGTVTLKPSNKKLASILFNLEDTIYDIKNNEWKITHLNYNKIKKNLKLGKFVFKDIPKGTLNLLNKTIPNKKFELLGEIYEKMFNFQREAVIFALNRGGRVILGDDMGLGKTIQALGIAFYYKLEWPLLVIAPASLLDNWAAAIKQFLSLDSRVIRCRTDFGDKISIISFDMCSKFIEIVKTFDYGVIIVD